MSTGVVAEFREAAYIGSGYVQAPRGLPIRSQFVTFTTSTQATNAIGSDCGLVGIWADADCYWEGGTNPTAAASTPSLPLFAGQWFFFVPTPGTTTKIAFVDQ